ncbi:hypothetical protein MED121_18480 [Marinomonas sp. MED121]|uniref:heteromeric transposase endonuclease subunit TnsA n=1 Tax=Marinomonas sp. MED121 TaxID=314277 RepID=UPI0000690CFB|nr:heteromeric transposase endonuclease subunit TnsA [Marinomonas sp. MED121]EAQ65255.1 hypothetical protein MED121_18480 [Marinomonas sp. MED121]
MSKPFHSSEARKIGITNRSVSGVVPDIGSYESTLERDFMERLRFEPNFKKITPQPITIHYENHSQKPRSYTPDGLLFFKEDCHIRPILYEIKYREDFKKSWRELLPKFRAAKKFAISRGWSFKVFTETDVRTPYLDNAKFLWPYKHTVIEKEMETHILSLLRDLQEADPDLLLTALCSSPYNRAKMIPIIWTLIANQRIDCDLDQPLTMSNRIWVKEI